MEPIVINAPSLANCNTLHIKEDIEQFRQAGVKYLHIDMMDGPMYLICVSLFVFLRI